MLAGLSIVNCLSIIAYTFILARYEKMTKALQATVEDLQSRVEVLEALQAIELTSDEMH